MDAILHQHKGADNYKRQILVPIVRRIEQHDCPAGQYAYCCFATIMWTINRIGDLSVVSALEITTKGLFKDWPE